MARRKPNGTPPVAAASAAPPEAPEALAFAVKECAAPDLRDVYVLLAMAEREYLTARAMVTEAPAAAAECRAWSDHAWRLGAKLMRMLLLDARSGPAGRDDSPSPSNPSADTPSAGTMRPDLADDAVSFDNLPCLRGPWAGWRMWVPREPCRYWLALAGGPPDVTLLVRTTATDELPAIPGGARVRGYYERADGERCVRWHPVVAAAGGSA
jgi:hypothetical protein